LRGLVVGPDLPRKGTSKWSRRGDGVAGTFEFIEIIEVINPNPSIGVCAMAKTPVEKTAVPQKFGASKRGADEPRAKKPRAKTAGVKRKAARKTVVNAASNKKAATKASKAVTGKVVPDKPVKVESLNDDAAREELWAQAELDYADPAIKVSEIAARVGLATIVFNAKVSKLGWPPRPSTETSKSARSAGRPKKAPREIELLGHVRSTIEGELTKLDRQAGDTSQDRERASRALSQMVNSLEKAIEMQREITNDTTKGAAKKNKEELAHAEDLRRAIAERIERLQSKRASDAGSAGGNAK
jgi:hypothetical protein